MKEIIECLDLAYHELRYVYNKQTVFVSEVIKSSLPTKLRAEYNKNPEFRQQLKSVLKYAVRYGKSVEAYAEGRKKIYRMPQIEGRKLNKTDLELLVGLYNSANLGSNEIQD